MGVLSDAISVLNVPRFLTPYRRSTPRKFLIVCVIFSVFLFFTLVYFSEMFWLDIVLILAVILVILTAFYYIIRDKDDLSEESSYSDGLKLVREKQKYEIEISDLEIRKETVTNPVERINIDKKIEKLKGKIGSIEKIIDSSMYGREVKRNVEESDREDLKEIQRREKDLREDINFLAETGQVETDFIAENQLASDVAQLRNLEKFKKSNLKYKDQRKQDRETSLKTVTKEIDNQNTYITAIEDRLKELQKDYLTERDPRLLKQINETKESLKEERQSRKDLEVTREKIRRGEIDDYGKAQDLEKANMLLRSAAAANDGIYRIAEGARKDKFTDEVLERADIAVCDRKVNEQLMNFALSLNSNLDLSDTYERLKENIKDSVALECVMKELRRLDKKEKKILTKSNINTKLDTELRQVLRERELLGDDREVLKRERLNAEDLETLVKKRESNLKSLSGDDDKKKNEALIKKLKGLKDKYINRDKDSELQKIRARRKELETEVLGDGISDKTTREEKEKIKREELDRVFRNRVAGLDTGNLRQNKEHLRRALREADRKVAIPRNLETGETLTTSEIEKERLQSKINEYGEYLESKDKITDIPDKDKFIKELETEISETELLTGNTQEKEEALETEIELLRRVREKKARESENS